jgi:xanthine/CO dehydrogenase XdhC/CoxF family maturation factor
VGGAAAGPVTQSWRIAQGSLTGIIYYNTYVSKLANGGAVMRIKPGSNAEVLLGGCNVCHSVSANGNVLAAGVYWTVDNPQVLRYGAAGLPGATYTCAGGVSVLVKPTSDQEASPEPDIALASAFVDDEIARSWYTAEDVRTVRESGAALALVVTADQTYYRTRF